MNLKGERIMSDISRINEQRLPDRQRDEETRRRLEEEARERQRREEEERKRRERENGTVI